MRLKYLLSLTISITAALLLVGCKEDGLGPTGITTKDDTTGIDNANFDINDIADTYPAIANGPPANWGPYNVHDPSILNDGAYFYCYTTDVAYGHGLSFGSTAGHQIRRSEDLVNWQYRGTAFKAYPPKGRAYIEDNGGHPVENMWAPYILKHNDEYRLYYSLASDIGRLSVIGLGVSSDPGGPFTERDIVVTSMNNNVIHTNAIDPTVITTAGGKQWMFYGSSWDGIWKLELDPATGLAKQAGDKGMRVAHRGFTGGTINGNIEGSEIIYNEAFNKYYMFIAYDWLSTKYNVRVVRSDNPDGPFYDYQGLDAHDNQDNGPMIIAPYKFMGHSGWQGVSHVSVFRDNNGQYYIAHQGRPVVDPGYMVLHVRKLNWTPDGWPVASPERYAAVEQSAIAKSDLIGSWERIVLNYQVVPGFADEQISPNLQVAQSMDLSADGTFQGAAEGTWSWEDPWLTLSVSGGTACQVYVEWGRDWEKKKSPVLVFSGLNSSGISIWGKKVD